MPGHVLITGASRGLGQALATHYAREGASLALCGRDLEGLKKTAELCAVFGAKATITTFDMRDRLALEAWIAAEDKLEPIDLVIANAGVSRGTGTDGLEDPADTEEMFGVNTSSAALTAIYAARAMLPRQRGQIALISSQAGRIPLVNTPGYSASKAGLRYYGLAMRESLAPKGVGLTVVCPGYVESRMKDSFEGYTPFTWSAQRAAAHIAEKLRKNPAVISFPFLINTLLVLYGLLPGFIRRPLNRKFSFTVKS